MGTRIAWTRAVARFSGLLVISMAAESTVFAQAGRDATSPLAVGSDPARTKISSAVGASDWLPGSPAAADSAAAHSAATDSIAANSAAADSADADSGLNTTHPDQPATIQPSPAGPAAGSAALSSAGALGKAPAADHFLRLPPNTATGISIGYPAYPGLFVVAPADGRLAFRSGLTGFPTIGLLWTPGLEYRFGLEPGTISQNGAYAFGNAFLGRIYLEGEREFTGAEAGFGFRWLIDDRRGVRWIAALEAGGYWRGDPLRPRRLCLRFIWTLVE